MHQYQIIEHGQKIEQASKAMIFLHGRGATAQDILRLADVLCDDSFYIAAPQATNRAWYPYPFMSEEKLNEPWLSSAVETVKRLIDDTAKYVPLDQIYLTGFSQGACLALETTSRYAQKYGGVIAFSGGLIGATLDEKKYRGDFEGTKVFIGNSDQDPHIPLIRSGQSKEVMEKLGAHVIFKVYPGMGHNINDDEINTVKEFILS